VVFENAEAVGCENDGGLFVRTIQLINACREFLAFLETRLHEFYY
jgi:hypothetical protein